MRVHILANLHRPDAIEAAKKAAAKLLSKGVEVYAHTETATFTDLLPVNSVEFANADLAVSFGGDGTLIHAAQLCSERGTPILGVYYGRFGFVTQCHPNEIGAALSLFLDGSAKIETRMMVQAELIRNGKSVATLHALNEAAIQRSATTRMVDFRISVDGKFLTRYPADGILIATPTGSTGYTLSAGGSIVDPSLRLLMLTAITPHTLSARPLIFAPESIFDVQIETRGDVILSVDGQIRLQMLSGDHVRLTTSPRITRLVSVDDQDFLTKLTERLLISRPVDEGDDE